MIRSIPRLFPLSLFAATLLSAAPGDFNGRWNLTLAGDARGRAWWLEVSGAGTSAIKGSFVGAPGGQLDVIPSIEVKGGELIWIFERVYRRNPKDRQKAKGVYRARLENGRLTGSFQVEGRPATLMTFIGKRAPELPDTDDGRWKAGTPVELFNGRDFNGWECRVRNRSINEWSVADGAMKNGKGAPDITSTAKFFNFKLHVEYRVAQKSNSGIGLRGRYEVQIFGDYGDPVSLHGNGALYSRILPSRNASKPPMEWQAFDITLIGRQVTIVLNGTTIIDHKEIEGLTAMATDPNEDQPGPITLQGDHGAVEFRKVTVTPLTR
ncbi:MAG: DUF1080 domain-containing protein [Bryobacteraceae bacterium]